ncbi:related to ATP-dependent DNA helicase [Pseudozyma flocculosa]|uniref:DNA 3'-5' helicase n=1 Tax=Pseudozyma flocculosa TaxID=84751 RepID=A0A5C3F4K2_9BASI|nr:related to ATP-dependent DNA helicase [Pseudozyma flocculosa]
MLKPDPGAADGADADTSTSAVPAAQAPKMEQGNGAAAVASAAPAAAAGSTDHGEGAAADAAAAAAAGADTSSAVPFNKRPQRNTYLASLSPSQLKAATHPPLHSLQILAGPGSGKTRVLTSRVAWLILDPGNNINPENIVVVTFTNKAANEMKSRLTALIGPARTANLVIGTFHATCAKYLRKYGQLIELSNNFTIVDADESKKLFKLIIKPMEKDLKEQGIFFKPEDAMSEVSKAKAKDIDPQRYREEALKSSASSSQQQKQAPGQNFRTRFSSDFKRIMADIYLRYQEQLREANALDFDDLLVYGVRLFRQNPQIARRIEHVLVDEFQDTNTAQYMLMSLMAAHCQSISVVGDPDQSIYGWRSAEVGNLKKMCLEFKGTEQVRLEENYRSTGAILEASLKVVQQDRARVEKGLHTSHPRGPPVTLRFNSNAPKEAWFIASEIKRIVAHSGGLLNYNDFAVLLRFNALSRAIEAEFQTQGIMSRMVGGHKFFDRMEIKDILGYLSLADNPGFTPAFVRVVNVPKRGIGENKIGDLRAQAHRLNLKPMEVAERLVSGRLKVAGIGPVVKKGLGELVAAVVELREMAKQRKPVSQLIEALLKRIDYETYLRREPDFDSRWENVKELISFATMLEQSNEKTAAAMLRRYEDGEDETEDEEAYHRDDGDFVDPDHYDTESLMTATPSTKAPSQPSQPEKRALKREPESEVIDLISSDEEDKGKRTSPRQPDKKRAKKARKTFGEAMLDRSSGSPAKATKKEEEPDPADGGDGSAFAVDIDVEDDDDDDEDEEDKTPLRVFLEASILATDTTEAEDDDGKAKPKVTISTCHAAKGLELEEGTYPSFRCEQPHEVDEECRLLYVAMTRAEAMLYLSYCSLRMAGGETRDKVLSHFISSIAKREAGGSATDAKAVPFCTARPELDSAAVDAIVKVTGRPKPEPSACNDSIRQFERTKLAQELTRVDRAEELERSGGVGSGGYGGYGSGGRSSSGGFVSGGGGSLGRFSGGGSFAPSSSLGKFSNGNLGSSGPYSASSSSWSNGSSGAGNAAMRQNLGFSRPTIGSFSTVLDDYDDDDEVGANIKPTTGGGGSTYATYSGLQVGGGMGRSGSGSTLGGGLMKRPLMPPSMQARQKAERERVQPPPPPRFTDEVRLKARPEDAIEAASGRTDGMAPRRRADLESFQQAHSSSMSSLLDLLPASADEAATMADNFAQGSGGGSSSSSSATTNGGTSTANGISAGLGNGKRRLGMGMARRPTKGKR